MQKNRALKKLGFRDTSTESSSCCQYLCIVRRGRQEGRKIERLAMIKCEIVGNRRTEKVGKGKELKRGRQEIRTVCNKRKGKTKG